MFKLNKALLFAVLFIGAAVIATGISGAAAADVGYDFRFNIEELPTGADAHEPPRWVVTDTGVKDAAETPRWEVITSSGNARLVIYDKAGGNYLIYGDGYTTTNYVNLLGCSADITLSSVSMTQSNGSHVGDAKIALLDGAKVKLILEGTNQIHKPNTSSVIIAGIAVPVGTALTITDIDGDGEANNSLYI